MHITLSAVNRPVDGDVNIDQGTCRSGNKSDNIMTFLFKFFMVTIMRREKESASGDAACRSSGRSPEPAGRIPSRRRRTLVARTSAVPSMHHWEVWLHA